MSIPHGQVGKGYKETVALIAVGLVVIGLAVWIL